MNDLVVRLPGAFAAALVDGEGETVDYGGKVDPFDAKINAAHWRLVLAELSSTQSLGRARSIVVRGTKRSFIVRALPEEYALVVLLRKRAGFSPSPRAFAACERLLCREAGWALPDELRSAAAWFPVAVDCDHRRRPKTVMWEQRSHALEVLGALVVRVGSRETGFRVRLDSGAEVTLVREPGDCWYADEALAGA